MCVRPSSRCLGRHSTLRGLRYDVLNPEHDSSSRRLTSKIQVRGPIGDAIGEKIGLSSADTYRDLSLSVGYAPQAPERRRKNAQVQHRISTVPPVVPLYIEEVEWWRNAYGRNQLEEHGSQLLPVDRVTIFKECWYNATSVIHELRQLTLRTLTSQCRQMGNMPETMSPIVWETDGRGFSEELLPSIFPAVAHRKLPTLSAFENELDGIVLWFLTLWTR